MNTKVPGHTRVNKRWIKLQEHNKGVNITRLCQLGASLKVNNVKLARLFKALPVTWLPARALAFSFLISTYYEYFVTTVPDCCYCSWLPRTFLSIKPFLA